MAEAVRCAHARTVCFMAERTVLPHISKKREYMVVSSAGRDSMPPLESIRLIIPLKRRIASIHSS